MAVNNQLVEALNDCIDRLHQGETIDSILSSYPDLASQLRPMLEAGLVVARARLPANDVATAQSNISSQIQTAINTILGGNSSLPWSGLLLVLLIVGGIAVGIFTINIENTVVDVEVTSTNLPAAPTVTERPSTTVTRPPATEQPMEVVTIIEGPVSAVQENIVTIFGQNIALPPNDPRLTVLQLGDVLRIETLRDGQSVIALDITFENILVVVNTSGQIWRGDDCNTPPPAWVDTDTTQWLIQCPTNNSNNNSFNSGGGRNGNDNDNDSDDDD